MLKFHHFAASMLICSILPLAVFFSGCAVPESIDSDSELYGVELHLRRSGRFQLVSGVYYGDYKDGGYKTRIILVPGFSRQFKYEGIRYHAAIADIEVLRYDRRYYIMLFRDGKTVDSVPLHKADSVLSLDYREAELVCRYINRDDGSEEEMRIEMPDFFLTETEYEYSCDMDFNSRLMSLEDSPQRDFINLLRRHLQNDDAAGLSKLIIYPEFSFSSRSIEKTINTPKEFLRLYPSLFTAENKAALLELLDGDYELNSNKVSIKEGYVYVKYPANGGVPGLIRIWL